MSSHGARVLGRRIAPIAVAISAAFALAVPDVRADAIDLTTCNTSPLTRPFAPWGDLASYELAPGGDLEKATWALSGGAVRARGSEPYAATGAPGSWSLSLPRGSSAQSPSTCVSAAYPTIRFFIGGTGSVLVTVVYGNLDIPAGIAVAALGWQPTPVMLTSSPVVAATSNGVARVSVRLTALSGAPEVDDVFIDPWNRG